MIEVANRILKLDSRQLQNLINDYLLSIAGLSRQTLKTYQKALSEFSFFFEVDKNFLFSVNDINRYRKYLEQRKRMQAHSIKTYLTALRRFLDFLLKMNLIDSNPAKKVHYKILSANTVISFLSSSQISRLVGSIDKKTIVGLRDIAIIQTIATTGCSEEDLASLICSNFRLFRKKFYLDIARHNVADKKISLDIPDSTCAVLQDYLFERDKNTPPPDSPLFFSYSNRSQFSPLTIRGVRNMIKQRLSTSGLNNPKKGNYSPLSLRQSGALYLASMGKTPEELMEILNIRFKPTALRYYDLIGIYRQ
jgi:site-specific recombinase XerD